MRRQLRAAMIYPATVLAVALDASGQVLNVAEVHPVE